MEAAREVKIAGISAEKLKFHTGGFFKHNTFVIVRMDSRNFIKTGSDSRGGSSPSWNETFKLPLVPSAQFLRVEVHCETVFGDKMLGKVKIPVSDFTGDLTPVGYLRFLSYRLRNKEGDNNGIVNLSVRMDGREPVCGPALNQIPATRMATSGFPMKQISTRKIGGSSLPVSEEIAIGIPVAYGFPV